MILCVNNQTIFINVSFHSIYLLNTKFNWYHEVPSRVLFNMYLHKHKELLSDPMAGVFSSWIYFLIMRIEFHQTERGFAVVFTKNFKYVQCKLYAIKNKNSFIPLFIRILLKAVSYSNSLLSLPYELSDSEYKRMYVLAT